MNIKLPALVLLVTCGLPSVHVTVLAQDAALQARFLSEYRPAGRKLRDFYGKVSMRAKVFTLDENTGKELLDSELVFNANGPWLRLEGTRVRGSDRSPKGRIRAMVVGPSYVFFLEKNPGQDQFAIRQLSHDDDRIAEYIEANGRGFFSPYSLGGREISDVFSKNELVVKEMVNETRAGKRLVKLYWKGKKGGGWLLFSPDDSWALQEYAWGSAAKPTLLHGVMQYSGKEGEIPLLKEAKYWVEGDSGKRLRFERHEITEVVPEEVPETRFRLPAFGLPEIKERQPHKSLYYLLGAAGLALACALGFRYLAKRKRAT